MKLFRRLSSSATPTEPSSVGKLVFFGGNGFVGQNMIRVALQLGYDVVSISRSGINWV
jgi:glutamate dehydrogenase/leucine dehydrogenase